MKSLFNKIFNENETSYWDAVGRKKPKVNISKKPENDKIIDSDSQDSSYIVRKYKETRNWAVWLEDTLICVTLYKKGADMIKNILENSNIDKEKVRQILKQNDR